MTDPIFVSPAFYAEAARHGFDMTRFAVNPLLPKLPGAEKSCLDACLNANDFLRPAFNLEPLKQRHYGLAKLDPPWTFKTYSEAGKGKSAEQHYDCMTLDDIFRLKVEDLAHPDGMWVWLYATAPMYDAARACFDKWNVKFVTQGVWVKMVKDNSKPTFGTGYVLRNCHEPFLIGKVGTPRIHSRNIRSAILEPRREHSRKPEQGYVEAAKMAGPYPKADIFARVKRPGWDAWGNEVSKFNPEADHQRAAANAA